MKCAIVTVAVGDAYEKQYTSLFRKNTEVYCKKYGYDFHLLTDYIFEDEKYKKPVFVDIMKWTIPFYPAFQQYDRIAIVDADMLITPSCPSLESLELEDKIGIINEWIQPSYEIRKQIHTTYGWADKSPSEYYKVHIDKDIDTQSVFNGGFLIVSPKHHSEWFRTIFHRHVDGTLTAKWHPFHFEQASLGYELLQSNNYKVLDTPWNTLWPMMSHSFAIGNQDKRQFHKDLYAKTYVMHYCSKEGWNFADEIREKES